MTEVSRSNEQYFLNNPRIVAADYLLHFHKLTPWEINNAAEIVAQSLGKRSLTGICWDVQARTGGSALTLSGAILAGHTDLPEEWKQVDETMRKVLTVAGHIDLGSRRSHHAEHDFQEHPILELELLATEKFVVALQEK